MVVYLYMLLCCQIHIIKRIGRLQWAQVYYNIINFELRVPKRKTKLNAVAAKRNGARNKSVSLISDAQLKLPLMYQIIHQKHTTWNALTKQTELCVTYIVVYSAFPDM